MSLHRKFFSPLLFVTMACFVLFQPAAALPPMPAGTFSVVPPNSSFNPTAAMPLPIHGGGIELPAPPADLQVKFITLGRGTQNYSCPNPNGQPQSIGATAWLFDLSTSFQNQNSFNALTNMAVGLEQDRMSLFGLNYIGQHYFDANNVPDFDLGSNGFLAGKKKADIPAPTGANPGPAGTGAVDWIELGAKPGSNILKEVYRVEVAGGNRPKSCNGQTANINVQYAAQYWFFA